MDPITQINQGIQPGAVHPTETTQPAANKGSGLINPNRIYQVQAGQNLVSPVTVLSSKPTSNVWKLIVLDALVIIFAAAFGYSFARYLAGGFSFWFVFVALLFWGAASVLQGFLQKNISHRILVIFFESVALIAFFYSYAWQALLITIALVFICLVWGYFSVRRELRNTVEVRFFSASSKIVGKVITAAVVFMVVMYASLSNDNGNFFVSQNGFNDFFTWAGGFVNNFYPSVPLNGSFGDFAQAIARMQLQGNPTFQSLTPAQQSAALSQSTDQVATELSGTNTPAPTPISPSTLNEPTSNALYNYFSSLAAKLQDKFGSAFIAVWGLILFLALRSVGIIAVWIVQFFSLIFYEFLLATNFMKIIEQPASKETIEY